MASPRLTTLVATLLFACVNAIPTITVKGTCFSRYPTLSHADHNQAPSSSRPMATNSSSKASPTSLQRAIHFSTQSNARRMPSSCQPSARMPFASIMSKMAITLAV